MSESFSGDHLADCPTYSSTNLTYWKLNMPI
ncbi:hypothetical protein L917_17408 [Phytophthora nicotianae]|uniref:Uncharacterized protein n=1 Tax=Phytophthora nicotianae TaxID=4792 RepID=W2KDD8_PHYNI|nr:hypothetical protein L917_17408 [Phytophthora nicotianae]